MCGVFAVGLMLNVAWALDPAQGEVLLVIDGNISASNAMRDGQPVAEFDLDMLKAFGSTSYTTSTPWTVTSTFAGVRLNELLAVVGADVEKNKVKAFGLDDYWYYLDSVEATKYPVIVAYEKNGKPLSLRELGPLWITFPWDEYPELLTAKNKAASVWQLVRLNVQ